MSGRRRSAMARFVIGPIARIVICPGCFSTVTVEKHPGQITILAIGPMTNLAIALRLRPDIEAKIKRLVYMGGAAHVPGNTTKAAEFNFWFDPEAARIVLRSK